MVWGLVLQFRKMKIQDQLMNTIAYLKHICLVLLLTGWNLCVTEGADDNLKLSDVETKNGLYLKLSEVEAKYGLGSVGGYEPNLTELFECVGSKVDFSDEALCKNFSVKVGLVIEKIDEKKLGKNKLAYKKVLLAYGKLKTEIAGGKNNKTKLKKEAEDTFKAIEKFAESARRNSSSDATLARKIISEKELQKEAKEAHAALLTENEYVSATKCQSCHPVHFQQWSMSQHAYAQLSPVFMSMQNTVNHLTNKTNGDFCIRCHTQVGMNKEEGTFFTNLDRHPASREGINCIVCHRIAPEGNTKEENIKKGSLQYGKVSGRIALLKGDIKQLAFGPRPDDEVKAQIDSAGTADVHNDVGQFAQISTPGFCGSCHDVNLFNGFRLEEAFSEYKSSPAAYDEVSCHDCHMGVVQGSVLKDKNNKVDKKNYAFGKIATSSTRERKMTDHTFSGPDHSIIHPSLFPTSDEIVATATAREWIKFNFDLGWGSKRWEEKIGLEHEDKLHKDFWPEEKGKLNRWMYREDRENARRIIIAQFEKMTEARRKRVQVLKKGYKLVQYESKEENHPEMITVTNADSNGIELHVGVRNGTNGHSIPTGFIAERLVWLNVEVYKEGHEEPVFLSGDLDPNGDVRDQHSFFVHGGNGRWKIADGKGAQRLLTTPEFISPEDVKMPIHADLQLFNVQSKFITRNIRGGEREQILTVNHSVDALPFIRPSITSTVLTGQPGGARIHRLSLPPNSTRKISYEIKGNELNGAGIYRIVVRLKSAMVPANLVQAISIVGFDYGMTPQEVARRVVFGYEKEVEAIRYYAIDDEEDLLAITGNKDYIKRAKNELKYRLAVVGEKEQKKMLDYACVTYHAAEVAKKKNEYVMDLFKNLKQGQTWYQSRDFMGIKSALQKNPMDHLVEVKSFLIEKTFGEITQEEINGINTIISVIDKNDDKNKYWNDAKIQNQVENGLIIGKVAGHEVLYEAEKTIEIY